MHALSSTAALAVLMLVVPMLVVPVLVMLRCKRIVKVRVGVAADTVDLMRECVPYQGLS